ncbi:nucleoside diphosphate kinase [Mortierella sp. GBA43]|nr:nucleoside diphosphate kinase [Mortierella sp. GBA43]
MVALESVIFSLHMTECHNIQNAMDAAVYSLRQRGIYEYNPSQAQIIQTARVLSAYHGIFIVAQIFQLILLCDAMFHKNTIQILAIVAFNCAMVAYAGVQVKQASDILVRTSDDSLPNMILTYFARAPDPTPYHASQPYEIVVLSLMVVFASGFAFIAYRLYKEFGWTIYKKIGADLAMRDMYKIYQIFIMILKFDIFFQLGFSAQFLSVVVMQQGGYHVTTEFTLSKEDVTGILATHLILSTGATIILPFLAWFGLKRESKISMSCFIVGGLAALVYNIMKLNQVKPDGVERGLVGEIIKRFENKGFQLLALELKKPSEEHLKEHYADLSTKPFFGGLIKYMTSGPVVAMVWQGKGVVKAGRVLLGETNPLASLPGTIRGDFALDVGRNICHGSDSVDNAEKEIKLWFPNGVITHTRVVEKLIYE